MLLQSLRLAWPIFSQGWPLFYFCHLWATQLLIHMQMKLAPSLVCISASARCSAHSTRLFSFTFLSVAAQILAEERREIGEIGKEADKRKLICALASEISGSHTDRVCCWYDCSAALWCIRGGGRGRERVACCCGLSPEWLRGGSWWQETQDLRWDLSAEWSMLQTIYEGESSFYTTEGRIGHQQLPNQSKMHNVNNSGDHTARCFSFLWGFSVFSRYFPPPLCNLNSSVWISLLSAVPLLRTFTVPFSLAYILSTLCAQLVSHSVWKENSKPLRAETW